MGPLPPPVPAEENHSETGFYRPDILAVIQPSVLNVLREHKALTVCLTSTIGLASSFLHLPPDS